ncbi:MAG: iron ABC transporter permease [Flavobacteriales bacterium]
MASIASLMIGVIHISISDLSNYFMHKINLSDQHSYVLESIRFPRTLGAILVGALLSLSGLVLQAAMKNDLAEPSLLGVSTGASFSTSIAIVLVPTLSIPFLYNGSPIVFAFVGSLFTVIILSRLSTIGYKTDVSQLILTGVAINALAGAGTGLMNFLSDDEQLRTISFWMMGSLSGMSVFKLSVLSFTLVCCFLFFQINFKKLNLLTLGENEAQSLGMNVELFKKKIIILVSLAVGTTVAFCGVIGFVGLVVPHVSRILLGNDHKKNIPATVLLGSLLLLVADIISRVIVLPAELPIGIVTAMIGAPFFIHLLRRNQKRLQAC